MMRNPIPNEFIFTAASSLTFGPLTDIDIRELLLPFYVGLNFDDRRTRFGGGLSDDAIQRHCQCLDLNRAIVLGCWAPSRLLAVIELHPIASDWRHAELSIADCAESNRTTIVGHLLQLAAFAAGKRGCIGLVSSSCAGEFLELFRGMGRLDVTADDVLIDISEYANILSIGVQLTRSDTLERQAQPRHGLGVVG